MKRIGFERHPWARIHMAAAEWSRTLCIEGSPTAPSPEKATAEIKEYAGQVRRTVRKRPSALILSGSGSWIARYLRVPADIICACSDAATLKKLGIPVVDRSWNGRDPISQLLERSTATPPEPRKQEEPTDKGLIGLVAAAATGYVAAKANSSRKKICGSCLRSTEQLWRASIKGFGYDWEVCNSCIEKWREEEKLTSHPKLIEN